KLLPPSVLTCHCRVGTGTPLAAALKATAVPAMTFCDCGFKDTVGATRCTSRVAEPEFAVPAGVGEAARDRLALWASEGGEGRGGVGEGGGGGGANLPREGRARHAAGRGLERDGAAHDDVLRLRIAEDDGGNEVHQERRGGRRLAAGAVAEDGAILVAVLGQ